MTIIRHHIHRAIAANPRCFYLFFALMGILVVLPFLAETSFGVELFGVFEFLVMAGAIVAVGQSRRTRVVGVLLAIPAVSFQLVATLSGLEPHFVLSRGFVVFFYAYILIFLLKYVFHPAVMSTDKLYGAASAYLLLGVLWTNLYEVLQHFYPGAFAFNGVAKVIDIKELLYFSFTVITTTGFGDIAPLLFQSRCLVILEQVTGVLYVAILIARLAGMYQSEGDRRS